MTDHPNGSPGSANTSERRRRADGEMAAATAGQVRQKACIVFLKAMACMVDCAESPAALPHKLMVCLSPQRH
jgi:hypothetical protein